MNPLIEHFLLGVEGLAILRDWPNRVEDMNGMVEEIGTIVETIRSGAAHEIVVQEVASTEGYSGWSSNYDEFASRNPVILVEALELEPLITGMPEGPVLDAACGTGRWTAFLAQHGRMVTGLDLTPQMLARARVRAPAATFSVGSMEHLPYRDSTFGGVLSTLALTHLLKLDAAFTEFARVLKPGGILIISDVHPMFTSLGFHAFHTREDGSSGYVRNYTHLVSDYSKSLKGAGLEIQAIREGLWDDESLATQRWAAQIPEAARNALIGLPLVLIIAAAKSRSAGAGAAHSVSPK